MKVILYATIQIRCYMELEAFLLVSLCQLGILLVIRIIHLAIYLNRFVKCDMVFLKAKIRTSI